jgi:ATP-dependent DNA helicase RecG
MNVLTQEELQTLLADLESDRVERTVSTNDTDKFGRAVCAFANDMPNHRKPGVLILGARDDGTVAGIDVTDKLLQNLAALRSDGNILPLPVIRVYKATLGGGDVAVVEVEPSDLPPVRYRGRVCIRVGPRRAHASEQEERILTERRSMLVATWDLMPVPTATLSELSLRLFSDYRVSSVPAEVIEANHRMVEEQLASFRFFDLRRGVVTVAGLLLFGVNPRYYLPGAYVQFLKFPGGTMTDLPVDQAEIDGDLATIVQQLHARVKANNTVVTTTGEGFRDEVRAEYPEWALRELLHNALIHRDYASTTPTRFTWFVDRIEIQNPGGAFGGITRETLTRRNAYRNPVIAEAMKQLGYVNRFGFGIQRAEQLLAENGNPPLEFDVDDHAFDVTIRRSTP